LSQRGRDWVRTTFWYSNVDPESTKYVDPGTYVDLMQQNPGNHSPIGSELTLLRTCRRALSEASSDDYSL